VTGILGYVSYTLSYATGLVAHGLLSYELFMVEQFARIPFASAHVSQFSFWYVVCFYVVFTIVFLYRKELLEKFGGFRNNIILFNYKWLIQLGLLSDTNKIIPVYFNTFTVKSNKNRNQSLSVFTRYSYKHVLEKISLVKKILNNIKNVIENPDEIRNGHVKSRLMLIKTIKNETRSQVVVIETVLGDNNYDFIIVTSFFANKKYLSGFELLWRTEILQNKMVPPSHIHIK
jgi:hypothetical protein